MLYGCQTNNGSFVIKLITFYIHCWLKGGWGAWSWLNQYTDIQWRLFVRIHHDNGITCRITWWMGRGRGGGGGVSQSTPLPLNSCWNKLYIHLYISAYLCRRIPACQMCNNFVCASVHVGVCVCVWACARVGEDVYVIWWSQTAFRDLFVCSAARKNRNVIKMCLFAWERKK